MEQTIQDKTDITAFQEYAFSVITAKHEGGNACRYSETELYRQMETRYEEKDIVCLQNAMSYLQTATPEDKVSALLYLNRLHLLAFMLKASIEKMKHFLQTAFEKYHLRFRLHDDKTCLSFGFLEKKYMKAASSLCTSDLEIFKINILGSMHQSVEPNIAAFAYTADYAAEDYMQSEYAAFEKLLQNTEEDKDTHLEKIKLSVECLLKQIQLLALITEKWAKITPADLTADNIRHMFDTNKKFIMDTVISREKDSAWSSFHENICVDIAYGTDKDEMSTAYVKPCPYQEFEMTAVFARGNRMLSERDFYSQAKVLHDKAAPFGSLQYVTNKSCYLQTLSPDDSISTDMYLNRIWLMTNMLQCSFTMMQDISSSYSDYLCYTENAESGYQNINNMYEIYRMSIYNIQLVLWTFMTDYRNHKNPSLPLIQQYPEFSQTAQYAANDYLSHEIVGQSKLQSLTGKKEKKMVTEILNCIRLKINALLQTLTEWMHWRPSDKTQIESVFDADWEKTSATIDTNAKMLQKKRTICCTGSPCSTDTHSQHFGTEDRNWFDMTQKKTSGTSVSVQKIQLPSFRIEDSQMQPDEYDAWKESLNLPKDLYEKHYFYSVSFEQQTDTDIKDTKFYKCIPAMEELFGKVTHVYKGSTVKDDRPSSAQRLLERTCELLTETRVIIETSDKAKQYAQDSGFFSHLDSMTKRFAEASGLDSKENTRLLHHIAATTATKYTEDIKTAKHCFRKAVSFLKEACSLMRTRDEKDTERLMLLIKWCQALENCC